MEKRTSNYKVIMGEVNTINNQLAGGATIWKPILMSTYPDPKTGTMIVVMLEHVVEGHPSTR